MGMEYSTFVSLQKQRKFYRLLITYSFLLSEDSRYTNYNDLLFFYFLNWSNNVSNSMLIRWPLIFVLLNPLLHLLVVIVYVQWKTLKFRFFGMCICIFICTRVSNDSRSRFNSMYSLPSSQFIDIPSCHFHLTKKRFFFMIKTKRYESLDYSFKTIYLFTNNLRS